MLSFADLIAPMTPETFFSAHYGRAPVHIKATDPTRRRALLDWARLNELLAVEPYWTSSTLKLVRNGDPIGAEHYCDAVAGREGARLQADPAKVQVFLSMGASLVADAVDGVSPELRAVGRMLSQELGGLAEANAYCSFAGVQGFGPHFDLHEVFAIHTEGEKVWRVYENRAEAPVDFPEGDEARRWFDQTKGRLLFEARMQPGDVMYLPRGWYHDALASSAASLHVTFSVAPHTGKVLFRLLEAEGLLDPAFRAYLPDARRDGGAALRERLAELGGRLQALMTSPAFEAGVVKAQRSLQGRAADWNVPRQTPLEFFKTGPRPAEAVRGPAGWMLRVGGAETPLGGADDAARWLLGRPAFSLQELFARFPHAPQDELRALVRRLVQTGALAPLARF